MKKKQQDTVNKILSQEAFSKYSANDYNKIVGILNNKFSCQCS